MFYSIYDHGVRTAVEWTSAFQIEQQIIGNMPTNSYRGTFGLILKMQKCKSYSSKLPQNYFGESIRLSLSLGMVAA